MENNTPVVNNEPNTAMGAFKRFTRLTGRNIAKNSPAILLGFGVVGFGVTAVLAYKARPKVEKVVEKIEEKRANCEHIDMAEVGQDMTKAVALPVVVGLMSAAAVVWSYRIQTNRIVTLSSVLAATQAAKSSLENRVKEKFGEEAYREMAFTEEVAVKSVDEDGNEIDEVAQARAEMDGIFGAWYDESEDYVRDDHGYNIAWIEEKIRNFEVKLFHKERMNVNDLREDLGLQPIKNGEFMEWTSSGPFRVDYMTFNILNKKTNELEPQILLQWKGAKYKYAN